MLIQLDFYRLLRIKRKNQTFFIPSSKADAFSSIKSQISEALSCCSGDDADVTIPENMRLYLQEDGGTLLNDVATIADHASIKDGSILYLVFREGGDNWEDIDIARVEEDA